MDFVREYVFISTRNISNTAHYGGRPSLGVAIPSFSSFPVVSNIISGAWNSGEACTSGARNISGTGPSSDNDSQSGDGNISDDGDRDASDDNNGHHSNEDGPAHGENPL
ncbi:hypothetical protein OIDMADRAFT_51825 [Oidiodendron maius Zn]|uniref:Uncharacterized protein n=1 Tax=Oidiodendron maius (strain Zn) TaxID=913774 RepID=A0A0C3CXX9_OIDMZ|nr:hypothetical protein OIDMADRAFT_51825 [Oidiodendron maius Zn]